MKSPPRCPTDSKGDAATSAASPFHPILQSRHIGESAIAISLIAALAAFSLTVTAVACGGELATGPVPFELDWETSASAVDGGESFTLAIRMYDVQEEGEHGGISVSFPLLTEAGNSGGMYSSEAADVEAVNYTTGLSHVTFFQPGATIYHKDDNRMLSAPHLLVESDDPMWYRSDDRTLTLRITPKYRGEFPIWIRGWICEEEYTVCKRMPITGSETDQQGYRVEVATIAVNSGSD